MNNWNDFIYYFIIGVTLILSVLGLRFIAVMPWIDLWNKRFFRTLFFVLIMKVCTTLTDSAMNCYLAPDAMIRLIQVPECLLITLPMPMLTVLLLHFCGENMRESRMFRAAITLWILYFVLVVCGLFSDTFYFVTPDRMVHRGLWYPMMLLPVNVIMLINLAGTIRRRKLLSRDVRWRFLIVQVPMVVAMLAQMFTDVFIFLGLCYVIFALSMYSLILTGQIEHDRMYQREIIRQQREIADQRAEIMVLQMRPHFIYNTLASIYCLCSEDPEKAQQVIMDFTTYLRQNFNAVASIDPIPFTSELEHTKAYLAVEQAQYAKSLFVEYDTPYISFRVPSLTLQPIVENAVKHGRNPDVGPLHIIISTCHMNSASVITVEDNGPGFDAAKAAKPHTTLANIRHRLELMCGGNMEIKPRDGGGTVVTMTIPDHDFSDPTLRNH